MKDLRDLMKVIEEGQYAFDDQHNYFDGVWDSFKKINNLSVPDAVMAPPVDAMRVEHKRRLNTKPQKIVDAMMKKTVNEDDTMLNREGGSGGNPGGDDDDAAA